MKLEIFSLDWLTFVLFESQHRFHLRYTFTVNHKFYSLINYKVFQLQRPIKKLKQ